MLRVGISPARRPARAAAAVPDRRARRGLCRQDRRLPPHRAGADRRRSGCRARRQSLLSAEELRFQLDGLAGPSPGAARPPGPRALRGAGAGAPGRRRGRARRPAAGPTGELNARANRLGTSPAGARAAPRGCRRGGDRAQPGLDGRRARDLQGRRRVPAHRAALPGRPHRDHALPGRVPAGADRARQHHHARPGPRFAARRPDALRRRRPDGRGPRRRRSRRRRRAGPARLHLLHLRLHR